MQRTLFHEYDCKETDLAITMDYLNLRNHLCINSNSEQEISLLWLFTNCVPCKSEHNGFLARLVWLVPSTGIHCIQSVGRLNGQGHREHINKTLVSSSICQTAHNDQPHTDERHGKFIYITQFLHRGNSMCFRVGY